MKIIVVEIVMILLVARDVMNCFAMTVLEKIAAIARNVVLYIVQTAQTKFAHVAAVRHAYVWIALTILNQ